MTEPPSEFTWVPVATARGLLQADLLSAEIRRAGIPAQVVQESAGAAFGLTTGDLGRITIRVPAPQADEARFLLRQLRVDELNVEVEGTEYPDDAFLEEEAEAYDPDEGVPLPRHDRDDGPDLFSRISRGAMVVAAVAFSPFGVALALIGSWLSGRRDR